MVEVKKNYHVSCANIKEWAANYDGPQFDAILCDPPYELGFMGKSWDSSGIAFDTEMWKDIYKLLKPGAHLLAFSGSRTYHRMAVAIEDAGFEIRDQLIWMYGSGFPKSLNIGKAVDKIQGNEREFISENYRGKNAGKKSGIMGQTVERIDTVTKGTSEWEGYGTALKPAHEPCVLARKPIDKGMTVAGNVLKHGTGGLNIDGTRVEGNWVGNTRTNSPDSKQVYGDYAKIQTEQHPSGRFPANLIHDGSDEVVGLFPDTGKSGTAVRRNVGISTGNNVKFNKANAEMKEDVGFDDSGSAARFFYTAKASKSERNAGLEGFEEKEGIRSNAPRENEDIKTPLRANHHPTVKPLSLTKYLATLIKPPTGGRLLVPFSGSGSEMIGALQAGWEYVEGVELTEEYIPIAEARIKYWLKQKAEEDNKLKQEVLL